MVEQCSYVVIYSELTAYLIKYALLLVYAGEDPTVEQKSHHNVFPISSQEA